MDLALSPGELSDYAGELIHSRQNVSPRRLVDPGPTPAQLQDMLAAAAAAPDHGQLTPWRFVIVPRHRREQLAEVFGLALLDRDPLASPEQIAKAQEKAHRAPLLMLVVARLGPCEPSISVNERMVSVGCAVQNILLTAHSQSFGSGLTSGQALQSPRLRALFGLTQGEEAVCFINVGTVTRHRMPRLRPAPSRFVSSL